jgi:DNA-binding Lrp family transcriptional regulator
MSYKDMVLIAHLRRNGRETLTEISKKTHIPISTLYDKLKVHENSIIKKHTTLLDFEKLGYSCKVKIILSVERIDRERLEEHLKRQTNVNSLFKINNGYDFMIEGIFTNIREADNFVNSLNDKFKVKDHKEFYIIEDVKREGFMDDPDMVKLNLGPAA